MPLIARMLRRAPATAEAHPAVCTPTGLKVDPKGLGFQGFVACTATASSPGCPGSSLPLHMITCSEQHAAVSAACIRAWPRIATITQSTQGAWGAG